MPNIDDHTHRQGNDHLPAPTSPPESDDQHLPMLSTMTLHQVEEQVLALPQGVTLDELLRWLDLTGLLVSRAKQIRATVEQCAVEWITTNGPICIGDIRYTVSHPYTVKCTNVPRCLDRVMEACGGDIAVYSSYLRSDPFKYGSVRQLLGQTVFDQLFRIESRAKLIEGKPQVQLVRTDQRFLR